MNESLPEQALTVAKLGAAVWSTMAQAEQALLNFSAVQGWSPVVRKSEKQHYTWVDEQGVERPAQVELYKVWGCSRGHSRQSNTPHSCSTDDTCQHINDAGVLQQPPDGTPPLMASTKTACPVVWRVTMQRNKEAKLWTKEVTPCLGYSLATDAMDLLPCRHNHFTNHRAAFTEATSDISTEVRQEVQALVQAGFASYRIRNFIAAKHSLPPLLPAVWNSLVRSIRIEMGVQTAGEDLQTLIGRLQEERNERGAVFDFHTDDELTVTGIFFMSRSMVDCFRRCAQFVVMDNTCKTNRFGMSLFLVCGVDEHKHIALYASAFMKDETQGGFEYVLAQLKRAVGMDAWHRMACVATDGCAAMSGALIKLAPHTSQQRCVWHLQQNIIKHAGSTNKQIITAWYKCVWQRTEAEFDQQWRTLMEVAMGESCREYLQSKIFPIRAKWACYSSNQLTNFGSHSTQLVESLNRLLKMWDVNDRASLAVAVERICTVKSEEDHKRTVTAMRDHALKVAATTKAHAGVPVEETYKSKLRRYLTGAGAKLCEEEYEMYSQYKATLVQLESGCTSPFTYATYTYLVQHTRLRARQYEVHVSSSLIYCPCGHCFEYLLPCRHVLAANYNAFNDVFQHEQYHPRWLLQYSTQAQQQLLAKQFWLSVGRTPTAERVQRAQYASVRLPDTQQQAAGSERSAAAGGGTHVPMPMYDSSSLQLVGAQLTPQHLYHLIDAECEELRQLVCTNPALLSGVVWTGLHTLKATVTAHIDREQRSQQGHVELAAAAASAYTSHGVPLTSLVAPVPITARKVGRPSNKRALAAWEGQAARTVKAMLPAHLLEGGPSAVSPMGGQWSMSQPVGSSLSAAAPWGGAPEVGEWSPASTQGAGGRVSVRGLSRAVRAPVRD